MYTIKRAAELTGVSAATLRAWERRYDVVEPQRTDAGYRLYDDEALARLRTMAELVADGWTASHAAAEAGRRHSGIGSAPGRPDPTPPPAAATTPAGEAHFEAPPSHLSTPPSSGADATRRLIDAAAAMDPAGVAAVLDERFATGSFEAVVDDWLMPALVELGEAWADSRVTVAGEHLVAHAVLRRLAAAFDAAASRVGGPRVIVGLPAGAYHELGVFAFAVALRRLGVDVVYLGADLPTDAWTAAVTAHTARCVVIGVPRRPDARTASTLAKALADHHGVTVCVGGSHQDDVEGATRLGHAVGPAAAQVAGLL
ncbi:MerR family transcriptional regulator [Janibacter hoylei PVAS-1]|uniref:Transcriptional regulator n=1 Tax=Janibacter hoylei PVAS-1 TaxID=1210046 RepID=K1ESE7_9MICO|nr:MerR family transcriptional regulator [Janibacter hoylei]EKA62113.1 MerR family transcriptional regulator [Janibacter hoylei PVAS-1]RWU85162.1 transcriptional regulator [Janibacter hoylei PVAS-1]